MRSPSKNSGKSPQKALLSSSLQKSSAPKPVPSVSNYNGSVSSKSSQAKTTESDGGDESLLWVDKYKPKSLKQVIGQSGDKSNAKKLLNWLKNWQSNRAANVKPSSSKYSLFFFIITILLEFGNNIPLTCTLSHFSVTI